MNRIREWFLCFCGQTQRMNELKHASMADHWRETHASCLTRLGDCWLVEGGERWRCWLSRSRKHTPDGLGWLEKEAGWKTTNDGSSVAEDINGLGRTEDQIEIEHHKPIGISKKGKRFLPKLSRIWGHVRRRMTIDYVSSGPIHPITHWQDTSNQTFHWGILRKRPSLTRGYRTHWVVRAVGDLVVVRWWCTECLAVAERRSDRLSNPLTLIIDQNRFYRRD